MKKILIVFVAFISFILPFGVSAFASGVNLIDGKIFIIGSDVNVGTSGISVVTDGNSYTYASIGAKDSSLDTMWYMFDSTVSIDSLVYNTNSAYLIVRLYDSTGAVLHSVTDIVPNNTVQFFNAVSNVKYVSIYNPYSVTNRLFDFKVFESIVVEHTEVTNLSGLKTYNSVNLSWNDLSSNSALINYKVYRDGFLVSTLSKEFTSFNDAELEASTTYSYKVTAVYSDGHETPGITTTVTTSMDTAPGNISNLNAEPGENDVSFTYYLPIDSDFSHLKVLRNNEVIAENVTTSTFIDSELNPETTYEYRFISVDHKGNESSGVIKSVTTDAEFIPLKDVTDVNVETNYNRVDLSWNLPKSTEFHHVNIYRDEVVEEPNFLEKLFLGVAVSAADEPTKIFETNGTYFNDLTVQPETTYEYKLTSESTTGDETEGVTVQAITLEEPEPELDGGGYTEDENGDYLYKWTSPTNGQVKVLINGTEYKTVDASLKELLIPKEDMKYDFFGNPDVKLVPISESGKEGPAEKPEPADSASNNLNEPFTVKDLIGTGVNLLWVVGPFLLFGLSFILAKKFVIMLLKSLGIKHSYEKGREKEKVKRQQERQNNKKEQEKKKDIEQREKRKKEKVELTKTEKNEIEKKQMIKREEERQQRYISRTEEKKLAEMENRKKKRIQQERNYKAYTTRKKLGKVERQPKQPRKQRETARTSRIPRAGRER